MSMIKIISGCALIGSLLLPTAAGAAPAALPFSDISKHYAKKAIVYGYENGLFSGANGSAKFEPDRYMTRGEFMVVLDRLFSQNEQVFYPLLMLSEHDELGLGEGFDEPHLPYVDVDRMTWLYQPVLRMDIAFNKMYGPNALERIFPGKEFHPNQPITKGEVTQLFALFHSGPAANDDMSKKLFLLLQSGQQTDKLTRGDGAILAVNMLGYMAAGPILPLLDPSQTKFPIVPEIEDIFPLFGVYTDQISPDESLYVKAAARIRNYNDEANTWKTLQKLADEKFYNQVGVHYYLSWNPEVSLQENMKEAFLSIDAYFADKVVLSDTLELLVANVYDLALKIETEDPKIFDTVLAHLRTYESKIKPQSQEWQALATYEAAMEAKRGNTQNAIDLYTQFPQNDHAMLNAVYYLHELKKDGEIQQLLDTSKDKETQMHHALMIDSIKQELNLLAQQSSFANDLSYALHRTDNTPNVTIQGESQLNGYSFKYQQTVDNEGKFSHVTGYYQAPESLVLQKLETYYDDSANVEYLHDFEEDTWSKQSKSTIDYMHEWVDKQSVFDRVTKLNARYLKQSFGDYDVITEWIPSDRLRTQSSKLQLGAGRLKSVPTFVTKYYLDHKTNLLVRKVWRYEEIYDKEYAAYSGSDTYQDYGTSALRIPLDTLKGAVEQK
ncbi:UNVERIFIED_CONTAM: hypothetical protein ABID98_002655 [Brevibacillus sp. OAP136]